MPTPVRSSKWKIKEMYDKGNLTVVKCPDLKEVHKNVLKKKNGKLHQPRGSPNMTKTWKSCMVSSLETSISTSGL